MLLADFTFGDALLTVLEIFLFVAWLWILFAIFSDLFRDHETSGWAKAGWVLVLFILPFLGVLIYLIARGHGMRDRAIAEQAEMRKQMDTYVRQTAGSGSPAGSRARRPCTGSGPASRRWCLTPASRWC